LQLKPSQSVDRDKPRKELAQATSSEITKSRTSGTMICLPKFVPPRVPTSPLGASKEAGSLSTLFPLHFLIASLTEVKSRPSQTSRGTPQAWVLTGRRLAVYEA